MKYTQNCSVQISELKDALATCEAVIIGAGAGLSTSAGFVYGGRRFHENFSDFEMKYNFHDMYSGGFYPFETPETFWAYWSRFIFINRYQSPPKPVYTELSELIKGKEYFIITTNVDHCFQKAGFEKERLFYTQGDYGLFQCSTPCHDKTYDNEEIIRKMVAEQKDMKIPPHLVPHCPLCGEPMTMNLRSDNRFVQDSGWGKACKRYEKFVNRYSERKILYLELGVGGNTPGIIKYPFWQLTAKNNKATYASINLGEAVCPPQIANRSILINEDIGKVLSMLLK